MRTTGGKTKNHQYLSSVTRSNEFCSFYGTFGGAVSNRVF